MTVPAKPHPRRTRYYHTIRSGRHRAWLLGALLFYVSYFVSTKRIWPAIKDKRIIPNQHIDNSLPFKVAIYMTTHLNQEHVEFLTKCWPAALQRLPLLHHADLLLYTSSTKHDDLFLNNSNIGFGNVTIHRYHESKVHHGNAPSKIDLFRQKQLGSLSGAMAPYQLKRNWKDQLYQPKSAVNNSWFAGYDWIIRLQPDVLLRRDDWLISTMSNASTDAILVDYDHQDRLGETAIHADFYAFRPHAVNVSALIHKQQLQEASGRPHAEPHLYAGFQDTIQKNTVAWLPHVQRYRDWGRVTGPKADVVHWHDVVKHCPNYFSAHDGKYY